MDKKENYVQVIANNSAENYHQLPAPTVHVTEIVPPLSKNAECRNSLNVISELPVKGAIISETIHSVPSSPSTQVNFTALYQSFLRLHLKDSPLSSEKTINKLSTKGHIPGERGKILSGNSSDLMFVILGWSGNCPADSIEVFDSYTKKWSFLQQESLYTRAYHGVALVGNHLYIIGGFNGHTCQATTICFNVKIRQWSKKSCMSIPRCYVVTLAFRGQIYAIGGHSGFGRLKSCERFEPNRNRWTPISDMLYRRSDAAGAELNGKIIVSGGFDGHQLHSTTEMYDPINNQWTLIERLMHPRSGHSMISVDGHLYVLGGYDGSERLREVEKFNAERNRWEPFVPMIGRRSNFCSVVYQQEIYVIGGYDGQNTKAGVERFDKSLMEWQSAPSLNLDRSAARACVFSNSESMSACALRERIPVVPANIEEPSP